MRALVRFNARTWTDFSMVVDLPDATNLEDLSGVSALIEYEDLRDALWEAIVSGECETEPYQGDVPEPYEAEKVEG